MSICRTDTNGGFCNDAVGTVRYCYHELINVGIENATNSDWLSSNTSSALLGRCDCFMYIANCDTLTDFNILTSVLSFVFVCLPAARILYANIAVLCELHKSNMDQVKNTSTRVTLSLIVAIIATLIFRLSLIASRITKNAELFSNYVLVIEKLVLCASTVCALMTGYHITDLATIMHVLPRKMVIIMQRLERCSAGLVVSIIMLVVLLYLLGIDAVLVGILSVLLIIANMFAFNSVVSVYYIISGIQQFKGDGPKTEQFEALVIRLKQMVIRISLVMPNIVVPYFTYLLLLFKYDASGTDAIVCQACFVYSGIAAVAMFHLITSFVNASHKNLMQRSNAKNRDDTKLFSKPSNNTTTSNKIAPDSMLSASSSGNSTVNDAAS